MAHSWPFPLSRVSSEYGPRAPIPGLGTSSFHRGIDFAVACGTPIRASEDGVVIFAAYNGSAGNEVILSHPYSKRTEYMHMREISIAVGTVVKKGDVIGYVGTTGASTGCHLHWGTIDVGNYRDPREFIAIYGDGLVVTGVGGAGGTATPIPAIRKKKPMQLIRDTSPTYWLVTESGMWVVDSQAKAEMVDRVINYTPSRADMEYVVGLLQTPPWFSYGRTQAIDPAAIKKLIEDAFEDVTIPTPSISPADRQAIIDGAGAKAKELLEPQLRALPELTADATVDEAAGRLGSGR